MGKLPFHLPLPLPLSHQLKEISSRVGSDDLHQCLDKVRALFVPIGHTA